MRITIDRENATPVYIQISGQIRRAIYEGKLAAGVMLPSERKLADYLGIHRNTVTRAYLDLKSEGLIESHQGRGYRISTGDPEDDGGTENAGDRKKRTRDHSRKDVNWPALIQDRYENIRSPFDRLYSMSYEEGLIPFGGGVAAREPYPAEEIAEYFERILGSSPENPYFYTPYQGDPRLLREIARFLDARSIRVRPSGIQVFSETNQSMDYLNSLLLSEGDAVVAPEILSPDIYRSVQLSGGRLLTVPMDGDGILCDHLEQLLERERPKYIYIDSSFNNPTGTLLSVERRRRLLELSYRHRIPIIEEDEASELYYDAEPIPSIRSMDAGSNVIYVNSFALTSRPGLGISFVAADRVIAERLHNMVSVRLAALDWTPQMITLEYLQNGLFEERLGEFRRICREKRDRMHSHLQRLEHRFGISYSLPSGGVYFWIRLPGRLEASRLLSEAMHQGVTFIPGYVFYPKKNAGRDHIRLNFSYPSLAQIDEGMLMLERALERCV